MKRILLTFLGILMINVAMSQNNNNKLLFDLYDYYKSKKYIRVNDSLYPVTNVVSDDEGKFCYIEILLPSGIRTLPNNVYKIINDISEIKNGEIYYYRKQFLTGKKLLKKKPNNPNIPMAYIGYRDNELVLIVIENSKN